MLANPLEYLRAGRANGWAVETVEARIRLFGSEGKAG